MKIKGQAMIATLATAVAVSAVFMILFGYNVNRTSGVERGLGDAKEEMQEIKNIANLNKRDIEYVKEDIQEIKDNVKEVLDIVKEIQYPFANYPAEKYE